MENAFNIINSNASNASGCGSCHTTGCGTCAPAPAKVERTTLVSRRDLGRAALAVSASAILGGCSSQPQQPAAEKTASAPPAPPPASNVAQDLNVVQKSKGQIMTVLEEFYKMGPGPSSSHTMGPMRITYDFFQRVNKLPEDQLKRATTLQVNLFGSLSAT